MSKTIFAISIIAMLLLSSVAVLAAETDARRSVRIQPIEVEIPEKGMPDNVSIMPVRDDIEVENHPDIETLKPEEAENRTFHVLEVERNESNRTGLVVALSHVENERARERLLLNLQKYTEKNDELDDCKGNCTIDVQEDEQNRTVVTKTVKGKFLGLINVERKVTVTLGEDANPVERNQNFWETFRFAVRQEQ